MVKKDQIEANEIKKDRDERVNQLRAEILELQTKFDELAKCNSALTVQHQHLDDEYKAMVLDYDKLKENLDQANNVRRTTEEDLSQKTKEYLLLQKKFETSVQDLERLKKENDKYDTRLKEEEKKNSDLSIQKESIAKQADI